MTAVIIAAWIGFVVGVLTGLALLLGIAAGEARHGVEP